MGLDDDLLAGAEGVANELHNLGAVGLPIDPLVVAWSLDAVIVPTPGGRRAACVGPDRRIYIDMRLTPSDLGWGVLHECAHLRRADVGAVVSDPAAEERGCDLTAAAIAMPRAEVRRIIKAHGFHLDELRAAFGEYVSAEAVARRIVDVYNSTRAWLFEAGRMRSRAFRVQVAKERRQLTPIEREVAAACDESGEVVYADASANVAAWPVVEQGRAWRDSRRRVIVIADLDVLWPATNVEGDDTEERASERPGLARVVPRDGGMRARAGDG